MEVSDNSPHTAGKFSYRDTEEMSEVFVELFVLWVNELFFVEKMSKYSVVLT